MEPGTKVMIEAVVDNATGNDVHAITKSACVVRVNKSDLTVCEKAEEIEVGDTVLTRKFEDSIKNPGWSNDMNLCVNKEGVVQVITYNGDWLYVKHPESKIIWVWPRSAVELVKKKTDMETIDPNNWKVKMDDPDFEKVGNALKFGHRDWYYKDKNPNESVGMGYGITTYNLHPTTSPPTITGQQALKLLGVETVPTPSFKAGQEVLWGKRTFEILHVLGDKFAWIKRGEFDKVVPIDELRPIPAQPTVESELEKALQIGTISNAFQLFKKADRGRNGINVDYHPYDMYEQGWQDAINHIKPALLTTSEETYTRPDLVSFATYFISKERHRMVSQHPAFANESYESLQQRLSTVSDADIENWKNKKRTIKDN